MCKTRAVIGRACKPRARRASASQRVLPHLNDRWALSRSAPKVHAQGTRYRFSLRTTSGEPLAHIGPLIHCSRWGVG